MLVSTQSFMEPLQKWAKAIGEDDFLTAKRHAESLIMAGEVLALHPDFRRCFAQHCHDVDPHEALVHLCRFLICATDGRGRALGKYGKGSKPGGRVF
jgi:hypothetical protein